MGGGSMDTQQTRTVYILFSRSQTWFSRVIHLFTGGDFTHVSIGLDSPRGPFWSFGRKYPQLPFPGGFIQEGPERGFFLLHPETPCTLRAVEVSEETYQALRAKLTAMAQRQEVYTYNLLGTAACFFGVPVDRRDCYFCSQFVAEALSESGAVELPRVPSLTRPMDLWGAVEGWQPVYRGAVGALAGVGESA